MQFEVGDNVKVVQIETEQGQSLVGCVGTVVQINADDPQISVDLEKYNQPLPFSSRELEKID